MRAGLVRAGLVIALVFLALSVLTACDDRPCLQGHDQFMLVPIWTGKVMTMVPETTYVCDKYAPEKSATP